MNGFIFSFFIIIIYFIIATISQSEFIVKQKDELTENEIKSKSLGFQLPLVVLFNIGITILYLIGENDFFDNYFYFSPFLMSFIILLLFLFTFNSSYILAYQRIILYKKEYINTGFILLPLLTFLFSFLFIFIIILLCISINPVEWLLVIKDFFGIY